MNIRKLGFWTLDFLTGQKNIKIYKSNTKKYNDLSYDDSADLNQILNYAQKYVPFYKSIKEIKLEKFPVVDKMTFKENGNDCISDEYVNNLDSLHKFQTSGSTGNPMVGFQDSGKRRRVKCDLIWAHESIGWQLGGHYVFIRNWSANYKQSKIRIYAQNCYPVSIADLDEDSIYKLLHHLRCHKNSVLFGYSSSIVFIKDTIVKNNIDISKIKLSSIVCDSDELQEYHRVDLEKIFKCHVVNRYDNEENGLIAISHCAGDKFHVNYPSLHLELLELDSDKPVQPGEMGRVVITDLFSKAMPLIRYDTGDLAISLDDPNKIRTLENIVGRKSTTILTYEDKIISAVALSGAMEVFHKIERYQLKVLEKDDYLFTYQGFVSDAEYIDLRKRLIDLFGEKARIEITKVSQLEVNKNTGKFQTIVKL